MKFKKNHEVLPVEQRLDYLFDLNKISNVRSNTLNKKFDHWKQLNIYDVAQELKKLFHGFYALSDHDESNKEINKNNLDEKFEFFDIFKIEATDNADFADRSFNAESILDESLGDGID